MLKYVVCSAAEVKCAGFFHNGCTMLAICNVLNEMVHLQQPTWIKTDNNTANSFVHASICSKQSRSWDMQFHWLREATTKKVLEIY
eukprot:6889630-Ditylum_brightwellii.AAC.1